MPAKDAVLTQRPHYVKNVNDLVNDLEKARKHT